MGVIIFLFFLFFFRLSLELNEDGIPYYDKYLDYCKTLGHDISSLKVRCGLIMTRFDDMKNWDLSVGFGFKALFYLNYLNSYDLDFSRVDKNQFIFLFLHLQHTMHDLHMKINIDGVVRHVFRFLASGCYNTAHMGTWIHNLMEEVYFMASIRMVKKVKKFLKSKGLYEEFYGMFVAWQCGSPLFHHSDDKFKACLFLAVILMEVVDPMRFYADNFNMAHKVEVQPYLKSPYSEELEQIIPILHEMNCFDDIFFNGADSYPTGSPHGPMKLFGFRDRVNSWRPLITEFKPDGTSDDPGCIFLKHYFSFIESNGRQIIIPRRNRTDLFPKMIYPVSSLNSVADHILKIRAYMYSTPGDFLLYSSYLKIHDALMVRYNKPMLDPADLKHSKRDKQLEHIKYKLGIDNDFNFYNRPPSYEEVCLHYFPKLGKSEEYLQFCLRRDRDVSIISAIKAD